MEELEEQKVCNLQARMSELELKTFKLAALLTGKSLKQWLIENCLPIAKEQIKAQKKLK